VGGGPGASAGASFLLCYGPAEKLGGAKSYGLGFGRGGGRPPAPGEANFLWHPSFGRGFPGVPLGEFRGAGEAFGGGAHAPVYRGTPGPRGPRGRQRGNRGSVLWFGNQAFRVGRLHAQRDRGGAIVVSGRRIFFLLCCPAPGVFTPGRAGRRFGRAGMGRRPRAGFFGPGDFPSSAGGCYGGRGDRSTGGACCSKAVGGKNRRRAGGWGDGASGGGFFSFRAWAGAGRLWGNSGDEAKKVFSAGSNFSGCGFGKVRQKVCGG